MDKTETDFVHWAFGVEFWNEFLQGDHSPLDLLNEWHKRHAQELVIDASENVRESLEKMCKLYEETKAKGEKQDDGS